MQLFGVFFWGLIIGMVLSDYLNDRKMKGWAEVFPDQPWPEVSGKE